MSAPEAPPTDEPTDLEAGKLFLQFVVGVFAVCGVLLALGSLFRGPLLALSEAYVDLFGGPGLFAVWAVLDVIPFPVFPQDAFMAITLLGGMSFAATWAWSTAGSLCGGLISYACGRWLRTNPWYVATTQRGAGKKVAGLIRRNRAVTLALCAVSPLPFSTGAWACGATDMRLGPFVAVSLLRGPRILFYLWLIQIGAIDLLQ